MQKKQLDMIKLVSALDNENNQNIVEAELDYTRINATKNQMLQQLQLPRDELKQLHKQLKTYRCVETLAGLRFGSYIRWISLKNPAEIKLTNGGIICDIKNLNEEIHILCRNRMNRLMQVKLNENIIFQKLNEQEQVLLSAMEYLNA